jgi:general secretion pathway protein L
LRKYIETIARHVRIFLGWWFAELSGLVPAALLAVVSRRRIRVLIDLHGERPIARLVTAGRQTGEVIAKPLAAGVSCHVRIPSSAVMRKALVLPLAAADMLRDVLDFQVDQETPFRSGEVYFDYAVVARDNLAKQVVVDWVVAPKDLVDRTRKAVEDAGFTVASIGPVDEGGIVGAFDLLRHDAPVETTGRRWVRPALAACLALLTVAAIALPLVKKHRAVAAQREQVVEARTAAQAVLRLREQVAALRDTRDYVIARRLERPVVSVLLRELTQLLPDDMWLHRLTIGRMEVSIAGFSPASSTLVQDIEAHARFEQVAFRSPTMRQPDSGLDEFNLSFRISAGAPGR